MKNFDTNEIERFIDIVTMTFINFDTRYYLFEIVVIYFSDVILDNPLGSFKYTSHFTWHFSDPPLGENFLFKSLFRT
jgi:hypothetical protein